jgi:hypothetical protein
MASERFESVGEDDWEEPTRNGGGSRAVKDLTDPDVHVMLGKMARAVADTQAEVKALVKAWRSERAARARGRRREAVTVVSIVTLVQGVLAALHQFGVLK